MDVALFCHQPSRRLALKRALERAGMRPQPVAEVVGLAGGARVALLDADSWVEAGRPELPAGLPPLLVVEGGREAGPSADDRLQFPAELPTLGERLRSLAARSGEPAGGLEPAAAPPTEGELLGRSPAMQRLGDQLDRLAGLDLTVLLVGETGTGKELAARALHERGPRRDEPFVAVHCGAIPAELLESELFGHERGSFTDAHRKHRGRFVTAGAGTLLLDEIGEMPLALQAKLLRALEARELWPVGAEAAVPLRARVVAATNRPLEAMVERGEFRADLLHRLRQVELRLPPLREREGDLELLAAAFLARHAERAGQPARGLAPTAWERCRRHDWPGNVRELDHRIQRGVALGRGRRLGVEDLGFGDASEAVWEAALRREWEQRRAGGEDPDAARRALLERARGLLEEG